MRSTFAAIVNAAAACALAVSDAAVRLWARCAHAARLVRCALVSGDLDGRLWFVPRSRGSPVPGAPRRGELCVVRLYDAQGEVARYFARGGDLGAAAPRDVIAARALNETRVLCATLQTVADDVPTSFDVTREMYAPLGRFTPLEMAATLAGRDARLAGTRLVVHDMAGQWVAGAGDDVPLAASARP